jgi:hypothetical protein
MAVHVENLHHGSGRRRIPGSWAAEEAIDDSIPFGGGDGDARFGDGVVGEREDAEGGAADECGLGIVERDGLKLLDGHGGERLEDGENVGGKVTHGRTAGGGGDAWRR